MNSQDKCASCSKRRGPTVTAKTSERAAQRGEAQRRARQRAGFARQVRELLKEERPNPARIQTAVKRMNLRGYVEEDRSDELGRAHRRLSRRKGVTLTQTSQLSRDRSVGVSTSRTVGPT